MRGGLRLRQLALLALAVFSIVGLTAACADTSTPHREIGAIGVMSAMGPTAAGGQVVTFDDGRTYEMPAGPVTGRGTSISVGDLILAGSKPSNWVLIAPLRVPDSSWHVACYGLVENGDEKDTTVELDFGVTLQKAPDFDENGRNPKHSTRVFGGVICLNRDGQVRKIF